MNNILTTLQVYLDQAINGPVEVSDEVLDEFAASCRRTLERHLREAKTPHFLRMSNVGRPQCQLQSEKANIAREVPGYNHAIRMMWGDIGEALMIALLRASGVNVEAVQTQVKWETPYGLIEGTYDVKIDGSIYDIKTASPYSFEHKFLDYGSVIRDDTLGYGAQGFGYAEADEGHFGGWIVLDKSSGNVKVITTPEDKVEYEREKDRHLKQILNTVKAVTQGEPFRKCFQDVPETFNRKETGNRILNIACEFCPFKYNCWPAVQIRPALESKAQNPPLKYYTHIDDKYQKQEE